eukprot:TRINITY_DN11995_c0_g3_i1.p1 TRINITY_DN11995_c0_g3~~TRINITY_DN11995_c0_g3_i1.p1  ORF type:complete len:968 (+),score=185.54 TRINITY_DN11995_c0_g3_i1:73-2976(+)
MRTRLFDSIVALEIAFVSALQSRNIGWLKMFAVIARWLITDEIVGIFIPILSWTTNVQYASLVMVCMALSEILNGCIKWAVQRPRPSWEPPRLGQSRIMNVVGAFECDYSFPSSHAQVISTIGTAVLIQWNLSLPAQVAVIAMVILTGLARIYLGVHYTTDVLCGWLIGIIPPMLIQYFDVISKFNEYIFWHKILIGVGVAVVLLLALTLIRWLVPPPPLATLQLWDKTAHENEKRPSQKHIYARSLDRYHFVLFNVAGGIVAAAFGIHDVSLRFFHEQCSMADFLNGNTFWRAAIGTVGTSLIVMFGCILLPKLLSGPTPAPGQKSKTARSRLIASSLCRIVFALLCTFWTFYLWPKIASDRYGLVCKFTTALDDPLPAESSLNPQCVLAPFPPRTHGLPKHGAEIVTVESLSHLRTLIQHATTRGGVIRTVGAAHSQQLYQATHGNTTYIALDSAAFRQYRVESHPDGRKWVYAGAGMSLGAANHATSSWNDSLLVRLWNDGLALPNLPGILRQTVGGAISTGSEGGSLHHSIYSTLRGIQFMNGQGVLQWAWRNDTDNTLFRAAAVSMGLLGVITEVVFEPVAAFCTRPVIRGDYDSLSDAHLPIVTDQIAHQLLDNVFVRKLPTPLLNRDKGATFRPASVRFEVEATTTIAEKVSDHSTDNWCGKGVGPESFFDLRNSHLNSFLPPINQHTISLASGYSSQPQCTFNDVLHSPLLHNIRQMSAGDPELTVMAERCVAELQKINRTEQALYGIDIELNAMCTLGHSTVPASPLRSAWQTGVVPYFYNLAFDQLINENTMGPNLSELTFELRDTQDYESAQTVIRQLFKSAQEPSPVKSALGSLPPSLVFPELYTTGPSDALLSFTRNRYVLRVSLISLGYLPPYETFKHFWTVFAHAHIPYTMHWGKFLPVRQGDEALLCALRARYGEDLQRFRAVAEQQDPQQVFRDTYWQRVLWDDICKDHQ